MAGDDRQAAGRLRILALAIAACAAAPSQAAMSQKAQLSYSMGFQIGHQVGQNLLAQQLKVDPKMLARGVEDAISGHKPLLTIPQMEHLMQQMAQKRLAALRKQAQANGREGDAFLAANKKKPGVVTLPSGLQYQVLKKGTGPRPSLEDEAVVNYKATFPDGKEFATGRKTPMPVGALVPGLKQALLLMNEGSEWKVVIPPSLGFGVGGPPPVGPNRTLVFDLHLVGIRKIPQRAPGAPSLQGQAPAH